MKSALILLPVIAGLSCASPAPSTDGIAQVIPGDGMPSLESLNLTSADLNDPNFLANFYLPDESDTVAVSDAAGNCHVAMRYGSTKGAKACKNYLIAAGTKECATHRHSAGDLYSAVFCTADGTAVSGVSTHKASSYCRDVATGVEWVIKKCAEFGKVRGQQAAGGNGNLIVGVGKKKHK